MSFISKAFETIGKGISTAFKATGEIAKGVLTLDLKGAAKGVSHLLEAEMQIFGGVAKLTPAAVCANTLLNGAFDKLLDKTQKFGLSVANGVINKVADDLAQVKDGVFMTVNGLATGDLGKVTEGLAQVTDGVSDVARDFTPKGLAENTAESVIATVVCGEQKVS
ncbi:hypothetical protein HLB44_34925 [Aquincola sp. S2]|uniref:Uncharacterized protein n=1 Tax=Pseudaquabacterium terrae TaxID=2732868 RepID=A0ABX2EUQ6_9BURK|nr:hypothetical protein [Aquabacterium terrae]NRF72191.1 hypothetical protein [Aquabacterium terrae]